MTLQNDMPANDNELDGIDDPVLVRTLLGAIGEYQHEFKRTGVFMDWTLAKKLAPVITDYATRRVIDELKEVSIHAYSKDSGLTASLILDRIATLEATLIDKGGEK